MASKDQLIRNMLVYLQRDAETSPSEISKKLKKAIGCLMHAYDVPENFHLEIHGEPDLTGLFTQSETSLPPKPLPEPVPDDNLPVGDPEEYNIVGNELSFAKLYEDAIDQYTKAIELNPKDSVYYYNRGVAYYLTGRYYLCIDDMEDAIKLDPDYGTAYDHLGMAYSRINDFNQARNALNKAIRLEPNNNKYKKHLEDLNNKLQEFALGYKHLM